MTKIMINKKNERETKIEINMSTLSNIRIQLFLVFFID
jgi:hypothetical protein